MSPKLSASLSSMMRMIGILALMSCLLLLAGERAFGQDVRASLGGRVADQSGASVAKATVRVTADETGVVQTTATNSAGEWMLTALLPGHYHFQVSAPGFKTEQRTSIELQLGDKKYVDTLMQVGTVAESVTVLATTPLIDLSSAASGAVLSQTELEEFPSQSNAVTMDVAVLTGAQVSGGVGGGVFLWSNGGLSDTTVNGVGFLGGAGVGAISLSVDGGTDNVNSSGGQLAFEPPTDAVGEVRVIANAYDASLGRSSAANEIISLKSGAEKFHGDLYEDNQGTYLNANSYVNDSNHVPLNTQPIHVNEYGGSVGGPVWIPKLYDGRRKKTFFFFTYAGIRNIQPSDSGTATVPSDLERVGDFSQSYTVTTAAGVSTEFPIQLFNPASTNAAGQRTPYSFPGCVKGTSTLGNIGPSGFPQAVTTTNTCESLPGGASGIDPIAQAYLAHIPHGSLTPTYATSSNANNIPKLGEQNDKFRGYTLRLDQTEGNSNHSFISMYYNSFGEVSNSDYGTSPQYLLLDSVDQFRQNRGITFDHVIAVKDNLVLDLSYHVLNWVSLLFDPSGGVSPSTPVAQGGFGFPVGFASQMQDPSIPDVTGVVANVSGNALGTTEALRNSPTDLNQDINVRVSQTHKNHDFRYGFEYLIQQEHISDLGASGGTFAFGSNYTSQFGVGSNAGKNGTGAGYAIAEFELGLPGNTSSIPTNATEFLSSRFTALYFQDDWRYTPKLTFNLGLRWDYERPTTERYNRFFSRYNLTAPQTAATAASAPGYAADYAISATTNNGSGLLQQWGPAPGAFQVIGGPDYAGVNGTPRGEINPRYKYFQPRVGFAYQILNNTVLRGGAGRFVEASFNQSANQNGFSISTPYCPSLCTNYYSTGGQTWDNPYPQGLTPPPITSPNSVGASEQVQIGTGPASGYAAPNLGRIYVDTVSLGVQRQIGGYLFEVDGLINRTNGLGMQSGNNKDINVPSAAAWFAANTPVFPTPGGLPNATLPGSTTLPNPFKNVANFNPSEAGSTTETAYQLLRPNPTQGDIYENTGIGKAFYYALNTSVVKRFANGFSLRQSFAYSKRISEDDLYANQAVAIKIEKRLDTNDTRFNYSLFPVYELPFGKGKQFLGNSNRLVDEAVGGWEFSLIYHFISGTPITFPTNGTAFFQGGDPKLKSGRSVPGPGTSGSWFDTTKFAAFPTSSTTIAQLAAYPAWTGVTSMPGAGASASGSVHNGVYNDFATWNTYNPTTFGDVRTPYITTFTLGLRKSFAIAEGVRFQMRMDLFNALNHPTFPGPNVTANSSSFGNFGPANSVAATGGPAARQVQISGRLYF